MARTCLCIALVALVGCDAPANIEDAGPRDAGPGELDGWVLAPPAEPEISWLAAGEPDVTPPAPPTIACPTGWRSVTDADGVDTCDPWPVSGTPACTDVEMAVPGGAGCTTVGSACAADGWPADLPASGVRFVLPGASGTGTRASPFGTIAAALIGATPGTTIALASGEHAGPVALPAGVTLVGACASGTTIRASSADLDVGVLSVTGAGVVVRDVALTGPRPGVTLAATASLTLEDAIVHDVVRGGVLLLLGGSLTASDVLARDVAVHPTLMTGGRGFDVREGGSMTLDRIEVRRSHNAGLIAWDPATTMTVHDAWVHDVLADPTPGIGRGLDVELGASFVADRVAIDHVVDAALESSGAGSSLVVRDVVVRDVAPSTSGESGGGVAVDEGAHADVQRGTFERLFQFGFFARDAESDATFTDVVVRDVVAHAMPGAYGTGVDCDVGATMTVSRADFARTTGAALFVGNAATLTVTDFTARDVALAAGAFGVGLHSRDATATLTRVHLIHLRGVAVLVDGSTASLTDVEVSEVEGVTIDPMFFRIGITTIDSVVTLTRVVLRDVETGILLGGGTFEVLDFSVSGIPSAALGNGLAVLNGGRGTARRVVLRTPVGFGAYAFTTGSELTLEDAVVIETSAGGGPNLGFGIGAASDARVVAHRIRIQAPAADGISAYSGGVLDATDIVVDRSGAGLPTTDSSAAGLTVVDGTATIARLRIIDPAGTGVHAGGTVSLVDVDISGTAPRLCEGSCTAMDGTAISVRSGSFVLDRFRIRGSALAGLQVLGADVTATRGEIVDNLIGVNIQVEGFDPARLAGVLLTDNVVDLDARELPVPTTSPPPEPAGAPSTEGGP